MKYSDKLKDPRWQRKRLKILERDDFKCQLCGDREAPLSVHHKYYKNNYDPWDYSDESLITLCEECHKKEERYRAFFDGLYYRFKEIFSNTDAEIINSLLDYIKDELKENPMTIFYTICELIYDKEKLQETIKFYRDKLKKDTH